MTAALQPGAESVLLRANPKLTTTMGGYSYLVEGTTFTVSDGTNRLSMPITWAFGRGTSGQTWLFERDGSWFESRLSYFGELKGLDLTIGQQELVAHNLLEAAGRLTPLSEAAQCFDCHATNVVRSPTPSLASMRAGIQCERCHGPSEAHLRNVATVPAKLGALSTEEMSDFCGQCHRTWAQISANGPHGIQNLRFQPYRLANSKCYDAADARISCTACHNPHRELETNAAAYDGKCLACHAQPSATIPSTTTPSAKTCPVAKKDCVTCHMPRLDLPGAHKKFTDHRIRVVRANESYPD